MSSRRRIGGCAPAFDADTNKLAFEWPKLFQFDLFPHFEDARFAPKPNLDSGGRFDLEFGNHRKVVRGDQCVVAALDPETLQGQMTVVIEMVQVQEREKTRIRTRVAGEGAGVESFEHLAHEARREAARPFVEVTHDDSWAATLAAVEYFVAEELASLMTALDETGAEMNVEEVKHGAVGQ
jgi:hypothetical protein